MSKTLEGPQGQAFKQKLREGLDQKSKEIQEQFQSTQQSLIRKSSDRENELSQQIDQLKVQTRMLTENASVQAKLNEKMDVILEMNNQNLADIKAELAKSNQEKSLMQTKMEKLEEAIKKTAEWVDESNTYTDEEMEKLKQSLLEEIEEARSIAISSF